jgi:hypothetical protein
LLKVKEKMYTFFFLDQLVTTVTFLASCIKNVINSKISRKYKMKFNQTCPFFFDTERTADNFMLELTDLYCDEELRDVQLCEV